ncbi:MAG: hypothetical protein II822_07635 [Prevotella sp.]|nr:hypothetical protein [Prevotella sp.]
MKKKLLLFAWLLVAATCTYAADGTLSIGNVRNAVPGYTGSLDIVLSGSDKTYVAMQFDLTLPEGLTLSTPLTSCYAAGALINGHGILISDQGSGKYRLTAYANPTADFTAANGTLLTLYFSVASTTTAGDKAATLSDVTFSYNRASYHPSVGDNTITVGNTVTLSEEETAAPAASSGAVDVTVNRTIAANIWSTLVLPFPMTNAQLKTAYGDDVQLAGFDGYTVSGDNINVSFVTSSELAAHTPYIIKVSEAKTSFSVSGVTITEATNSLTTDKTEGATEKKMIGTYIAETAIPDKGVFLLGNQFMYSKGTSRLKAFHAYFQLSDFNYAGGSAPHLVLDVFDMTTGIHSVGVGAAADGNAYNLKGQKVSESSRGVQIRNGKKVLKK